MKIALNLLLYSITILIGSVYAFCLAGCSNSEVISISNDDESIKLTYDCNNFIPKAETREEMAVLIDNSRIIIKELVEKQKLVTLSAFNACYETQNLKELERLIVEYKCKQRYGGNN
jgi:hypothetical protein